MTPTSPIASTSTASTSTTPTAAGTTLGKRKRLPACDSCKLRRLRCEAVPPPASCVRCKQTGVVCTTTPTTRKKATARTGKRIEEAKATFGTADPSTDNLMGVSNTPWVGRGMDGKATLATGPGAGSVGMVGRAPDGDIAPGIATSVHMSLRAEERMVGREIEGGLAAHLLELYQAVPQSWLPVQVRGRLLVQFEAAGRRLENLAPQTEVLARVTIALTSRLSSHPSLFSTCPTSSPIPSFESLTPTYLSTHQPDLREFGQRREEACEVLRKEAVRMAWERGTLVETSEESLASCYLLEMLEGRTDPALGKPYGSAFVSHLQTILNQQDQPNATMKVQNSSLAWSALIMREALYAASAGRTSHFTATDDLLLCGPVPVSIEEALMETVDDVDVRDSVTLFFRPMRPYTYHCARLARECSEHLTGTFARRQPFNEQFLVKYLTSLDALLHLFAVLEARIAFVLSPAATRAHELPAPFETERRFIMQACLYTLSIAWSSLTLPPYLELSRRLTLLRAPPPPSLPPHALQSRTRLLSRLTLLHSQMHLNVLKAARMVAQSVREAPSLAFGVNLRGEGPLGEWVRVLVEARTVEEEGGGEGGITREEKENDLRWMLDGLKIVGWSWSDCDGLVESIERALADLSLDPAPAAPDDGTQLPALELPTPAPLYASTAVELQPPPVPLATADSLPFDPLAFLSSDVLSLPPPPPPRPLAAAPPHSQNATELPVPPPHSALPDLGTLSSLFPPSTGPPTSSSTSTPLQQSLPQDLSSLINLYTSGGLEPLLSAPAPELGLNVDQLAGQFLATGRLDWEGVLGGLGSLGPGGVDGGGERVASGEGKEM
ncbi:hypothetical protein JCM11641_003822 [Rhodosporidiobolus odoratus]